MILYFFRVLLVVFHLSRFIQGEYSFWWVGGEGGADLCMLITFVVIWCFIRTFFDSHSMCILIFSMRAQPVSLNGGEEGYISVMWKGVFWWELGLNYLLVEMILAQEGLPRMRQFLSTGYFLWGLPPTSRDLVGIIFFIHSKWFLKWYMTRTCTSPDGARQAVELFFDHSPRIRVQDVFGGSSPAQK